jgi:hypothetical protein
MTLRSTKCWNPSFVKANCQSVCPPVCPTLCPQVDECRERRCCVADAVGAVGAAYMNAVATFRVANPSSTNPDYQNAIGEITAGYLTTLSVLYGECIQLDDDKLVALNDFYESALTLQNPDNISAVLIGKDQTVTDIGDDKFAIVLSSVTSQNPFGIFQITELTPSDSKFNFSVSVEANYNIQFSATSDLNCNLYLSADGNPDLVAQIKAGSNDLDFTRVLSSGRYYFNTDKQVKLTGINVTFIGLQVPP